VQQRMATTAQHAGGQRNATSCDSRGRCKLFGPQSRAGGRVADLRSRGFTGRTTHAEDWPQQRGVGVERLKDDRDIVALDQKTNFRGGAHDQDEVARDCVAFYCAKQRRLHIAFGDCGRSGIWERLAHVLATTLCLDWAEISQYPGVQRHQKQRPGHRNDSNRLVQDFGPQCLSNRPRRRIYCPESRWVVGQGQL